MIKYDIICDAFLDDLIKAVNEKIKKGWQLVGGIATMTHQPNTVFYQAMIKEDKPKEK